MQQYFLTVLGASSLCLNTAPFAAGHRANNQTTRRVSEPACREGAATIDRTPGRVSEPACRQGAATIDVIPGRVVQSLQGVRRHK